MNRKTIECRTNLSKEFLDAAVSWRGNLGPHEILYKLFHVNILNQREKRRFLRRSCGGIWSDGLLLARHGGNGDTAMGKSRNMVPRRGRWTSDNWGSWSALNGGLGEKTGGHLTGGHPLALALGLHQCSLFVVGGRSRILIFFWLFLQFNYLRNRRSEAVVEGFFYFGNKSTRTIQVPTTSNQMHAWEFCKLYGCVHTNIWIVIDPIVKEWRQRQRRKNILHDKVTVNVPT